MSLIDLVILGFTAKKDQSAYDLVKEMQFRKLQEWIPISEQAIYKNTKKLEERGYLENYEEGKKMYRITSEGRKYFIELMKKQIREESLLYLNFAPVLMNITAIPDEDAKELFMELNSKISDTIPVLEEQYKAKQYLPPNATDLIKLYLDMHKLLSIWLNNFIHNYNERGE